MVDIIEGDRIVPSNNNRGVGDLGYIILNVKFSDGCFQVDVVPLFEDEIFSPGNIRQHQYFLSHSTEREKQ